MKLPNISDATTGTAMTKIENGIGTDSKIDILDTHDYDDDSYISGTRTTDVASGINADSRISVLNDFDTDDNDDGYVSSSDTDDGSDARSLAFLTRFDSCWNCTSKLRKQPLCAIIFARFAFFFGSHRTHSNNNILRFAFRSTFGFL